MKTFLKTGLRKAPTFSVSFAVMVMLLVAALTAAFIFTKKISKL